SIPEVEPTYGHRASVSSPINAEELQLLEGAMTRWLAHLPDELAAQTPSDRHGRSRASLCPCCARAHAANCSPPRLPTRPGRLPRARTRRLWEIACAASRALASA